MTTIYQRLFPQAFASHIAMDADMQQKPLRGKARIKHQVHCHQMVAHRLEQMRADRAAGKPRCMWLLRSALMWRFTAKNC